jgi:uncharacterized membrane protein YfcA
VSLQDLLLLPLGLVAGVYGTIIGAGGGFVLVPALLLIFSSKPADELTAITLTVALLSGASASIAYARQGRIDYLTALLMGLVAIPGGIVGVFAIHILPRPVFDTVFGVLLLAVGGLTLRRESAGTSTHLAAAPGILSRELIAGDGTTYQYAYPLWRGLGLSGAVGFFSNLLGIGGGVLQVPVMISILSIPLAVAVPTSTLMLLFSSVAGVAVHIADGHLAGENARMALLLAAGAVPGAQLGAFLTRRFASTTVTALLIAALGLVGVRLILEGLI